MSFWKKRNRGLDDFAEGIRPEIANVRTDAPGDELLERIRASRAAGARVILPTESGAPRRSTFWYVTTAVAAVLAAFFVYRGEGNSGDAASLPSWFSTVAQAQSLPVITPSIRVTTPERLHALSLEYARVERTPAGDEKTVATIRLSMRKSGSGDGAQWRVVSEDRDIAGPRTWIDSLLIDPSTLNMVFHSIHHAPYRRYSRIDVTQRFAGLRVSGEMTAQINGKVEARRTFDRELDPAAAPYVADAFAPLYLMGVALHNGWRGRVSAMGWAVRDDDVLATRTLVIEGEDVVRVPAGEFDCWRMRIEGGGQEPHIYWVRKRDGLGIKTAAPGAKRELVLTKEQVPPG